MCILTITVVLIFIPNMVLGDSLNLTGSLNVNDTQIINTSNLLVSMLVSLAEAIIPILVGAAVGHKSINHWQEKKDRIASKNNIFTDYAQSFKCHSTLLDNFVERVFKSYVVFQKDDKSQLAAINDYADIENNINSFLKFSSDVGDLPSHRFGEEYKKL